MSLRSTRRVLNTRRIPIARNGIVSSTAIHPTFFDRRGKVDHYAWTTLDHRIRNISLPTRYRYSTITPERDDHSALNPLPLPRSINPSKGLFLIHLPMPPSSWPSHLDLYFPLLRKTTKWFKERGIIVNCIYDGVGTETEFTEGGEYVARLFTPSGSLKFEGFGEKVLTSGGFKEEVNSVLGKSTGSVDYSESPIESEKEILVCTHGSRDCRCSDLGGGLVQSLRKEIERRGLGIEVREVAHVGGHKYAANAITLPSLDMYSNLLPSDAAAMLDHLTNPTNPSQFNDHWRGRYGCSDIDQENIWASTNPSPSTIDPSVSKSKGDEEKVKVTVELRFKTYEGELRTVKANVGDTLLRVARANDLPSMEGSCGGNLECSTCHLYIPPSCPIPEPTDPELDMLGYALGYKDEESRLGCQIQVTAEMAGWCRDGGEFGLPRY